MKNRKPNRLKNYDYSQNGVYFVTVCVQDKLCFFGDVVEEKMVLSDVGEIVKNKWLWLANQYDYVFLDEFVVMPNHFHGILSICDDGRDKSRLVPTVNTGKFVKTKPLSQLIGAFKTTSSKMIHKIGLEKFKWQRSFYDHIIRNEKALQNIRNYIFKNPLKWKEDEYNKN